MPFFRALYGGTAVANYDTIDPDDQYVWETPEAVVEVGPRTAAHLLGHEVFREVTAEDAGAEPSLAVPFPDAGFAPQAPVVTPTATPTAVRDEEADVPAEQAPRVEPLDEQAPTPGSEGVAEPASGDDEPERATSTRRRSTRRRSTVTE